MDTLTLLTTRRSNKKLVPPAPNKAQLEQIFHAALHAPDHGRLHPYHFVVIEKEGLTTLADLLTQTAIEFNLDERQFGKIAGICSKPMIIGVVAKIDPHIEKVPAWEQQLTAGCAVYAMQLAAQSLGFDNVWITGKWTEGTALHQAFGCTEHDKIIALLMVGSAEEKMEREAKPFDLSHFVSYL
ncbi:nitroreductase family protein [Pasteurellaceae bacterium 22721_9_1]